MTYMVYRFIISKVSIPVKEILRFPVSLTLNIRGYFSCGVTPIIYEKE